MLLHFANYYHIPIIGNVTPLTLCSQNKTPKGYKHPTYSLIFLIFIRRFYNDLYKQLFNNQTQKRGYVIVNLDEIRCPDCGGNMFVRSSKKRTIKDAEGTAYLFRLRILKCKKCGGIHTEAPDFLQRFKHYSKSVIDGYLNGSITNISADNRTLSRWRNGK